MNAITDEEAFVHDVFKSNLRSIPDEDLMLKKKQEIYLQIKINK